LFQPLANKNSRFNSSLAANRKASSDGVYDLHTNLIHYPKNTQPTHAKWEQLPLSDAGIEDDKRTLTNGSTHLANGFHHLATNTIFDPVPRVISRNFLVTDTVFVSPPQDGFGTPGPNGTSLDIGPNGLPDATDHVLNELPEHCRNALLEAKAKETAWKNNWGFETEDGLRAHIKTGFLGLPN
jgi:chromatin structure-remodeling complex protein RSC7